MRLAFWKPGVQAQQGLRIKRFTWRGCHIDDDASTYYLACLEDRTDLFLRLDGSSIRTGGIIGLLYIRKSSENCDHYVAEGSQEEKEVIGAVSDYLDRDCQGPWRESLADRIQQPVFSKGDSSLAMALHFLTEFYGPRWQQPTTHPRRSRDTLDEPMDEKTVLEISDQLNRSPTHDLFNSLLHASNQSKEFIVDDKTPPHQQSKRPS